MKEIVSSPHLCVMQVEIDIYTFLKKVNENCILHAVYGICKAKIKKNVCLLFSPYPSI